MKRTFTFSRRTCSTHKQKGRPKPALWNKSRSWRVEKWLILFFNQNRDFGGHFAMQPKHNLVFAERLNGFFEDHLAAVNREFLLIQRFRNVLCGHRPEQL